MNHDRPSSRQISTGELAGWLERHPERWWIVDGDHRLTREVDFPCPSEELADALRRHHAPLNILDAGRIGPDTTSSRPPSSVLDDLLDHTAARELIVSWSDLDQDPWLLCEYVPIAATSHPDGR